MISTTFIALFMGFWAILYLCDVYLKTNLSSQGKYLDFIHKTGLSVYVCQIRWYSTCLNRQFLRFGQWRKNFLKVWFTIGVVISLLFMIISIGLLTLMIINTLRKRPVEQQVLTPVMPGVNIPTNQIGYYLLTLLVCGVLHEFGHAIAAVREQVKIHGFGLFIMAVYPGAFVDLSTEHLTNLSPLKQLRIYCAGVWHNIVLVLLALIFRIFLPYILSIFYTTNASVVVTSVILGSAVSGPRGLLVGDQITSLNNCRVRNIAQWTMCIEKTIAEKSTGYCVPAEFVKQYDISQSTVFKTMQGNVECCSNSSSTHLCFSYYTKTTKPRANYACLPARSTSDRQTCKLQSDCYKPNSPNYCASPSLDNSTRLIRIVHTRRAPLLFLGHPLDLHYSLTLSDYTPRSSFVPVHAPYVLETFANYVISLSGALALLNVVPCYALDGQYILMAILELVLSPFLEKSSRLAIFTIILLFGTLLVATNVVIALWVLFH